MPLDIRFMSGNTSLEEADGVLLGCPLEDPLLWRKGAAEFPKRCGKSPAISILTILRWIGFISLSHCDVGDNSLKGSDEIGMNAAFQKSKKRRFPISKDKFLLSVGGSHVITYPLLRAALKRYPDLRVVSIGQGHYF